MMLNMLEYYNFIKRLGIDIIYSGPLWADSVEGIGETLKKRLSFDDLPLSASQSVFSVFVEQMNNMLMYSSEKESVGRLEEKRTDVSKGVFILGTQDGSYFVQSGNIIKPEDAALVKQKIDYLNSLEKDGLRKYYKEQIRSENTNPQSKGAGLGLIEIARRSSSKIEYDFTTLEDGSIFFTMFVKIK